MHEHTQYGIDHPQVIVSLVLRFYIHEITVERIEPVREQFSKMHTAHGGIGEKRLGVLDDRKLGR